MGNWKSYLDVTEVIVHAGGLSERWYPITQGKISKVLTEIGKNPRPVLEWVILPYVRAGIKKFFVTLWHQPYKIMEYCNKLKERTGIEFIFLKEEEKRLGRGGVIKHYLKNGTLDMNKHKITLGGSDIINIDLESFTKFHLEGLSKGMLATLIGSVSGALQFDKIVLDTSNRIIKMDTNREIILPKGVYANTGTAYFDAKLNSVFLNIDDNQLPIDWENYNELLTSSQCFGHVKLFENWFPLKTSSDYKKVKDIDFEKVFDVNAEEYLGRYE